MNLKYRLMIIFSLMTVIPLLIMFIMAGFTNYNSVESTLFEARLKSVHTNATHIQKYLESQKNDLDILADAMSDENNDKATLMRLFKSKHTEWEYLYFVNKDGQVSLTFPYTDFQGDADFSQREWFTNLRNNPKPYMSDTIISSATNATTFFIAYPVLNKDGTFEGVVGANLSLDFLNTSLPRDLQISPKNEILIVDRTSRILISSNKITSFSPLLKFKKANYDGSIGTYSDNKVDKVAFYTNIPGTAWTIYLIQDATELYQSNHDFLIKGLILLLLAISIAIFSSYYLANILTKPLNNLIHSIDATSDGQNYTFIDLPEGNDHNLPPEIKKLVDSLNNMIMALSLQQSELKEINASIIETIITLLEINDRYTVGHSHNVRHISLVLADKLGLNNQLKEKLDAAALLHDIGKIGINTNILNKPGSLTSEEYDCIKKHPFLGFMALQATTKLSDVSKIILAHHERYDGKGYPNNLEGDKIPLLARIISMADAFDAMYSDRPYRKGLTLSKITEIISEERGHQFDPRIADAMLTLIKEGKIS